MRVIDLSTLSVVGGSGIAETKIPLWWADGTSATTLDTSAIQILLSDGSTANGKGLSSSDIFTLSTNWSSTINFAFEATVFTSGSPSYTAYAGLLDITANTVIASVSTTSATAILVRSGKTYLTPSHAYGVTYWSSNAAYVSYVVDASLIVFPQ